MSGSTPTYRRKPSPHWNGGRVLKRIKRMLSLGRRYVCVLCFGGPNKKLRAPTGTSKSLLYYHTRIHLLSWGATGHRIWFLRYNLSLNYPWVSGYVFYQPLVGQFFFVRISTNSICQTNSFSVVKLVTKKDISHGVWIVDFVDEHASGQIYSDLTRPGPPNGGSVREIPLFQWNLGWII